MNVFFPLGEQEQRGIYPSTQKAAGLLALLKQGLPSIINQHEMARYIKGPGRYRVCDPSTPHVGYREDDEVEFAVWPHTEPFFPAFARPCPTTPKHGFVDSRTVLDKASFKRLAGKTLKQDPDGELIVMTKLTGKYSAVVSNAGITWGLGSDGATAHSKGQNSVHLPAYSTLHGWRSHFDGMLGVAAVESSPYLELVEHKGRLRVVQLRDGPHLPGYPDYIPSPCTVTKVVSPGYALDLLDWQKEMEKMQPGEVVYLPGGSLSCHEAVSAIVQKVPVITSFEPVLDTELSPTSPNDADGIHYNDAHFLVNGLLYWLSFPLSANFLDLGGSSWVGEGRHWGPQDQSIQALLAAVSIIQACPLWPRGHEYLKLVAFAVPMLVRHVLASCVGEARHFKTCGPGRKGLSKEYKRKHQVPWEALNAAHCLEGNWSGSREYAAGSALNIMPKTLWDVGLAAAEDLRQPGWKSSMGGDSWAYSARLGVDVLKHCFRCIMEPNDENYLAMISQANLLINVVHNGGPVLTKWISAGSLTNASMYPVFGLMSPAIPIVLFYTPCSSVSNMGLEPSKILPKGKWDEYELEPHKANEVHPDYEDEVEEDEEEEEDYIEGLITE